MYVILVNDDNTLIATNKERIMQRSKLVDSLCFLVPPKYKDHDMANFSVLLEYVLPISKKYRSEMLSLSYDTYNDHLKYTLPLDSLLTSESGKVDLQLTFAMADLDDYGKAIQLVRKTSSTSIDIIPISAWSDIIPDEALGAIDQRLIKVDAQIKALEDIGNMYNTTKADNLSYDRNKNELQLTSEGKAIGNKITIISDGDDSDHDEECITVIEF